MEQEVVTSAMRKKLLGVDEEEIVSSTKGWGSWQGDDKQQFVAPLSVVAEAGSDRKYLARGGRGGALLLERPPTV